MSDNAEKIADQLDSERAAAGIMDAAYPQQVVAERKYDLSKLSEDKNAVFKMETIGDTIVPMGLEKLKLLIKGAGGDKREPNDAEYLILLQTALSQQANPYEKEIGLMWSNQNAGYEVWVAAQVRIRKAQSQPDYRGYVWGYLTKDGARHKPGRESTAKHDDIVGIWGEVYREGRKPFYYETWLKEVARYGKWDKSAILMLQKTNRDQTHKFGFADKMGNLNTQNELMAYDPPVLTAPACETLPRDQRPELPEPTEEPEPTEPADNLTIALMVKGCCNAFLDKLPFEPADITKAWEKFATFELMCSAEDISTTEKWTMEMVTKVKAALDKDIPEPVLSDIAKKPQETEDEAPEPEAEKTAEEVKKIEDDFAAKMGVVEYKCGKCGKTSENRKGTEEKPLCFTCLSDDITVIKHGEEQGHD